MRYIKQTGYDAIIALEAENCLYEVDKSFSKLGKEPVEVELHCNDTVKTVTAEPGATLRGLLDKAGIPGEGQEIKAVHIGYPVGGLFKPDVLDKPLEANLLYAKRLEAGSMEIHVLCKDVCIVDYMHRLTRELQSDSCGRCVYCREGMRQLRRISEDVTTGRHTSDDESLIELVAGGMQTAGHCLYGRSCGSLWLDVMTTFRDEFDAHINRKRCDAMVCKKYFTYHILPAKCKGCTECLDVCPCEAIEGESKYIHVIDTYECDRCGKCVEVCEYDAIVKAGSIKPRTPDSPIRVGTWRGR